MTRAVLSRGGLGIAAILALPAVFWLDTLHALSRGWRPVGDIERAGCAILTLWVALTIAIAVSERGRTILKRRVIELWLVLIIVCFGLIASELLATYLRGALRTEAPFHSRGTNLRLLFEPVPETMPGLEGAAIYTTDRWGMRPDLAENDRYTMRLLCVGGSSTECTYLDDSETWPARLMYELNKSNTPPFTWIASMGISGYSTFEHEQLFCEQVLPGEVRGVIFQTGINDLWRYLADEDEAMDLQRFVDKPPEFRPAIPAADVYRPLWSRSNVIDLYHTVVRLREETAPKDLVMVESSGGAEYRIRRERRAQAPLTEALPSLEQGLARYGTRIKKLIECCRDRGLAVVFTTQPVLWDAALSADVAARCWFGWLPDGSYLSLGALREAMDAYNRRLFEVCVAQGVPCVDLSGMNGVPEFFYDDCHFTEEGAAEVGRRVAGVISGLIPRLHYQELGA